MHFILWVGILSGGANSPPYSSFKYASVVADCFHEDNYVDTKHTMLRD